MKKCHYCKRDIVNGRRIVEDGVKYVCKNDEDVIICNNIRNPVDENYDTVLYEQSQQHLKQNGATHIRCSCGHSFYTDFPMESDPGCDSCPKCGIYHYDNDKPEKSEGKCYCS
jgi:hypothetical protein